MQFIVPKVEWKKRHRELLFKKLCDFDSELFDIHDEVIILWFVEQFKKKGSDFRGGFIFGYEASVAGIHKGDIIDLFVMFAHH